MTSATTAPARSWTATTHVLLAAVVLTVLSNLASLVADLADGTYLNPYNATQYYLTWQDGFFRRGLPGTVLHLATGRDPSWAALLVVTAVVTALGLVATLVLVVVVARLPAFAGVEGVVLTVLVASPLTFSMGLHNRSRLDPLVVVLVVLLMLLPDRVLGSRWLSSVLGAGLAAAAVGSLELAVGFVAPLLLARALRRAEGRSRWVRLGAELAPALLLAGASLLLRPSPATVDRVTERFTAAGVAAPHENSVSVLTNTLPEALALNRDHAFVTRLVWFAVFAACFAVTVHLLRRLARAGAFDGRAPLVLLAGCAATACAASVVGFDYGRWFSLALVSLGASVVVLQGRPTTPWRVLTRTDVPLSRPTALLLVAVLAASVVGQHFPVYPAWG